MAPPFEGEIVTFDSFSFKAGGSKNRKRRTIKLGKEKNVVEEGIVAISTLKLQQDIENMLKEKFPALAPLVNFEDDESEDLRLSVSLDETPVFHRNAYDKNHRLGQAIWEIAKKHGRRIMPEGNDTILLTKAGVKESVENRKPASFKRVHGKVHDHDIEKDDRWVFHNTKSAYLDEIRQEGLVSGSFAEKPIDFGGDVWLAIKLSDLPGQVGAHEYGGSIAFEWNSKNGPISPNKLYLATKRGAVKQNLSTM
jgi:hypothetical protein